MGDHTCFMNAIMDKLLSSMNSISKKDFQSITNIIMDAVQEMECRLKKEINKTVRPRLKLCLLQLKHSLNKISELINNNTLYLKKSDILKLICKKMYLCINQILKEDEELSHENTNEKMNYHSLMSNVLSTLSSVNSSNNINDLIDSLLCSSLTIAKLSDTTDFKEINASCKNVLNAFSLLNNESVRSGCEVDDSYFLYHIKLLDRKVNTAMLRLFLHVMSYPQEALKNMVRKCGGSVRANKFSEDLDDEIGAFDLTCDKIALIGNFAIMSCDQEHLKLNVQNCLANLEFCEESLVPACIDFYLDSNCEKREFLKYLSNEWKSEVLVMSSLLDSIIDAAAFSLVVYDDLSDLVQKVKISDITNNKELFQKFYQRCMKFIDNITKSPDCLSDAFILDLNKSLLLELKINEAKTNSDNNILNKCQHIEIILSLVDQISEYLNKILNTSTSNFEDITHSTLKNISLRDSLLQNTSHRLFNHNKNEWEVSYNDNSKPGHNDSLLPTCYLEKAHINSPFIFTMYQKTPLKNKIKDNVALSLDI